MTRTTSLEMSKLLREAGFRQDTENHWWNDRYSTQDLRDNWTLDPIVKSGEPISAPTSDELFEQLPWRVPLISGVGFLIIDKCIGITNEVFVNVGYGDLKGKLFHWFTHPSFPEALAQMWLWLHSQGLLNDRSSN